jgi:phospholipase D1/2
MTAKNISQLVGADGKPAAAATSAPGCFIHDNEAVRNFPNMEWAKPFSQPHSNNKVDFYVTGEEYFNALATAIEGAHESIFIAGWQINFDVELKTGGKTLFEYLEAAIDKNKNLRIYVMPWLSPKVGVDTGDFETMLAIFQLNAGMPAPARAFALPAIGQSDMPGGLGIGFSHHQKLVVIDQKRAFVGGIDVAYGRRDNGKFSLKHDGRTGNELYNTCVPAVYELTHMDQTKYLTRAELIAACFDGKFGSVSQFITSAPMDAIAKPQDVMRSVSDFKKDTYKRVSDWWTNSDLLPEFVHKAADIPVDAAQDLSRWAYKKLDTNVKEMLDRLRKSGSANAADFSAALIAWLNNANMEQLPHRLRSGTVELIEAFVISTLGYLSGAADQHAVRYANLKKMRKMVPPSGKVISVDQPRMPWHDVHSSIEGAAVTDLCRNFILRWNGIAHRYESSQASIGSNPILKKIFNGLGLQNKPRLKVPRLPAPPAYDKQEKSGTCWVQVLRSAPLTMQRDEERAITAAPKPAPATMAQNNCLKAMLTAIQGSQKFIYIEGQFFQSEYGKDSSEQSALSGPMAALLKITASKQYEKYARQLEIYGVPAEEIPSALRWSQVDDVMADAKGKGADFMNDLYGVLKNIAAVKASQLMGRQQKSLLNPIGEALAMRVEAAIADGLPFHVYMVIPVHPEGTLNTLNIMTQLHLTMQSLVFGKDSLLNRIRRAIVAAELRRGDRRLSREGAMKIAQSYKHERLVSEVGDDWKEYLTLLNLRNWETLNKRHVTEQIYVHSKLLIADDRVAILGSANINDRSQLGDRDSELAVVIRDDAQIKVKLNNIDTDLVSAKVHDLRLRLWKKLFGLTDGAISPASGLAVVVAHPAAGETIKSIQDLALKNALAYSRAFPFLAHMNGRPSSIWPTWNNQERKLDFHMPFAERFWREDEVRDELFTWDAKQRAPESAPAGVQGFIVALPLTWTTDENNISGMNLTMLANRHNEEPDGEGVRVAANSSASSNKIDNNV